MVISITFSILTDSVSKEEEEDEEEKKEEKKEQPVGNKFYKTLNCLKNDLSYLWTNYYPTYSSSQVSQNLLNVVLKIVFRNW